MALNAQNRDALSGLLLALERGMQPSAGASYFADIMADQQAQRDARRDQIASLTEQLLGLAAGGQPLSAANTALSTLAEAGLVRPRMAERLEDVANTAYGRVGLSEIGRIDPTTGRAIRASETFSPLASPSALQSAGYVPPPPELPAPVEELAEVADAVRMFAAQGMPRDRAMAAVFATTGFSGTDPDSVLLVRQLVDEVYRDLGVGP
jgi:hypothetical protein